MALREELFLSCHTAIAEVQYGLAILYTYQEKFQQAEDLFLKALSIREQLLESYHIDIARSLYVLATLYIRQEYYAKS